MACGWAGDHPHLYCRAVIKSAATHYLQTTTLGRATQTERLIGVWCARLNFPQQTREREYTFFCGKHQQVSGLSTTLSGLTLAAIRSAGLSPV